MTLPVTDRVHVRVPATSANLGSGFDSAGLALAYYDDLEFTLSRDPSNTIAQVFIKGEGADTLPRDEHHLVVSTFRRACEEFGLDRRGFMLDCTNRIPQARGMGSSAEAIVAAVAAAYAFTFEGPLDRDRIFALASRIEGHPDNVAPAVHGGLTVSWKSRIARRSKPVVVVEAPTGETTTSIDIAPTDSSDMPVVIPPARDVFHTVRYAVDDSITASVFIPDFAVSTSGAREALPEQVPYADAVFNESRSALLPAAFNVDALATDYSGDSVKALAAMNTLLFEATQDRLHQSYRAPLMEASSDLVTSLRVQGFAAAISGAGPCVIVLHAGDASSYIDAAAITELNNGHWHVIHPDIDMLGVQVERS